MKRVLLLIILITIISSLAAEEKSMRKSIFMSAIAPGLGELYLGEYTKAGIFLGTEMAIIFAYFRLKDETEWATDSYKTFASSKAGISGNQNDSYYQLIQDYQSSSEYNASVMVYARNVYLSANSPYYDPDSYYQYLDAYLIPDNMQWDWETDQNYKKYRDLRREKQDLEIYTNFAFAAAILNRVISVIDTAMTARKLKKKYKYGEITVVPDFSKKGFKLNYEYKF